MTRKHDNYDWVLLLLFALGFKGVPGFGGGSNMDTTSTGGKGMTDDTTGGKNSGGSMDVTTGANNKNQDNSGNKVTMPPGGMGMMTGPPDKGTPVSGPMDPSKIIPTYTPNAGVQAAQAQLNAIYGGGNVSEGGNVYLNRNLPSPSGSMGSSITTVVYNPKTGKYDTFTNNELLFPMTAMKPPMSMAEMAKQPTPPGSMPPMMTQPMPLPNLTGGVRPLDLNAIAALYNKPQPMQAPTMTLPAPSGTLPNPLPQHPSLLSGLENFGQAALNQLLNQGKNLTGLFNNLQSILPVLPGGVSPRPLPFEVV